MSKIYILATVFLFWAALSASLMRVQLATSSVYKMRVPAYRSVRIFNAVAQVKSSTTANYN